MLYPICAQYAAESLLGANPVRDVQRLRSEYERTVGERAGQPGSRIVLVGYPGWMVP
jgi:hypothetical protein